MHQAVILRADVHEESVVKRLPKQVSNSMGKKETEVGT